MRIIWISFTQLRSILACIILIEYKVVFLFLNANYVFWSRALYIDIGYDFILISRYQRHPLTILYIELDDAIDD